MAINIRFKGIIETLANIATDKFAGRLAWASNIARMIWYYDAANYGVMARRDVLESFEAGIQDATVTAGQPMVAGASGRYQTQDAATFLGTVGAASAAQLSQYNKGTSFDGLDDPFTNREAYGGHGGVRTAFGEGPFGGVWYNIVDVRHRNSWSAPVDIWGGELVWGMTGSEYRMAFRSRSGSGVPTAWKEVSTVGHGHQSIIVDGTTRISTGGAATMASLRAANLSGSGTRPLVASPDGDIDDQDAATFRATIGIQSVGRRLWAEKDKAQTYSSDERSILGATSAQRMLAANTISDGTVVRLVAVGRFQASSSGSDLVVKLTCGPDGNYYSPYYLSSHGIPCAALAAVVGYKVEALLYFVGSGASAGVYVEITIQFFGSDGVVTTYRNASVPGSPLDVDGSIDRYLDVFFQVSGGASSYSTITPTHSFAEIITP